MIAVTLAGVVLGVLLGGSLQTTLGPFHAHLGITPSISGGTEIEIPPLGSLHLRSHAGPALLTIRLAALDESRARAVVTNPNGVEQASDNAIDDLAAAIRRLALRVVGAGMLGAMVLAAIVYRSMRRVAISGCVALGTLAGSGALAVATFRPTAIQEPQYHGLLANAPAVVGDARRIADQYQEYRDQLQRLVQNVSRLYGTISTLPVYEPAAGTTRVLHISDLHLNPAAWSVVATVVTQFNIDVVVDTGDITDWGSEPEDSYTASIASLKVPYLYIRGNHYSVNTAEAVASQPNATVLDNSVVTVEGLTFAGIGDPRFTPDKATTATGPDRDLVRYTGASLAGRIRVSNAHVDVAMVHDPISADLLAFASPIILAGHTHKREVRRLDGPQGSPTRNRSLLMTEGSTGGAGLRGLERANPLSLAMSVLYFDDTKTLQAYDDITVGGTGLSQVSLERHLVAPDEPASKGTPSPSTGASGSPSPGASGASDGRSVPAAPTTTPGR
jgi:predicted phosphodiesterase